MTAPARSTLTAHNRFPSHVDDNGRVRLDGVKLGASADALNACDSPLRLLVRLLVRLHGPSLGQRRQDLRHVVRDEARRPA